MLPDQATRIIVGKALKIDPRDKKLLTAIDTRPNHSNQFHAEIHGLQIKVIPRGRSSNPQFHVEIIT